MAQPIIQASFAAGELSPSLYARVDLSKYHSGAALLRNMFIDYRGGASNRTGTLFVGQCLSGTNRLIRFQFSTLQAYALVFSNLKMRVVMNGGLVTEPSQAITAITQANPGVLTYVGADPANGDWMYLTGIGGMTQLNGRIVQVQNVNAGANTYELADINGGNIDTTAYGAYTAGGTMARVFTLTTPYVAADLALLKYSQSADTMTITHPNYAPRQLTRTAHYAWTLTPITFQPSINPPAGAPVVTPSAAGATTYSYVVTAVNAAGSESVAGTIGATALSAIMSTTANSHCGVTWAAVAGAISYNIYRATEVPAGPTPAGALYGYVGSALGVAFDDRNITPDLTQTPPLANNPFATDYPTCSTYFQQRQCFAATPLYPLRLWASKSGDFLNMDYSIPSRDDDEIDITLVSAQVNAIKHLVSMSTLIVLTASGAWAISATSSGGGAITPTDIQAQPQAYNGCSDVPPIPVNYDILYVQAKGSVVRALTYNVYSNSFTEAKDMSVLANHLFTGHQITEWAWAEEPFKIAWCVREDGQLLSFTYLKEQDVYAWAHHDTLGRYKSVCSVSEPPEDAVYVIVERLVSGQYRQYIERMASRNFNGDVSQAWFVDCGLQYPLTYPVATLTPASTTVDPAITSVNTIAGGTGYTAATAVSVIDPTGTGAVLTATRLGGVITAINVINGGTNYTNPQLVITDTTGTGAAAQAITQRRVVFTATAGAPFVPGDVGKILRINGGLATVVVYTDATHVTANVINTLRDVWPALSGSWSMTAPVTTITGLDHLLGRTVAILADGNVEPQQVVRAVTGGIGVVLTHQATAVFIGLPFQAQLQTLYLDTGTLPTNQGKRMKVPAVTVRVQNSRGLKVGIGFATDQLVSIKERNAQLPGQPIQLITGDERIIIPPAWKTPGQVCAQQDDPLPCTILGLIPEIVVGDTVGAPQQ